MKKILMILSLTLVAVILLGYFVIIPNVKFYSHFSNPDKIIIHSSGKDRAVYKWNPLYYRLLKSADKRFTANIDYYMLGMSTKDLLDYEKDYTYVEFVYSGKRSTDYYHGKNKSARSYKNLIFPLTSKYSTCVFFDNSGDSSGPIGTLSLPDEMLKLAIRLLTITKRADISLFHSAFRRGKKI